MLREKVNTLCYTTTTTFFRDLAGAMAAGIKVEAKLGSTESVRGSPSKKHSMALVERKKAARRRIKGVEPLLRQIVLDEKEISGKFLEEAQLELNNLLEGNFETQPDPAPEALPEVALIVDAGGDIVMAEVAESTDAETNGVESIEAPSGDQETIQAEAPDIEMQDALQADAAAAEMPTPSNEADLLEDIPITAPLAEVNGNVSPLKALNGVKNPDFPDSNGYISTPDVEQPGPPTPPISNTDMANEHGSSILTEGGIHPALLKDFRIDGINISAIEGSVSTDSSLSEEGLPDVDMAEAVAPVPAAVTSATKSKKAKAKKKRR